MKKHKTIVFLSLLLIFALMLVACTGTEEEPAPAAQTEVEAEAPAEQPAEPEPAAERTAANDGVIKIGFIADVSGVGYLFSQSQLAGIKIALAEINEAGGILGQPVEYIMRDSQLKADIGATLARQMILEDQVDFLLGPTSSGVALAVSEVAKEHKVVVAFHTSNTAQLTTNKGNPYVVQVVPNTTMEGRAVANFAADLPYNKWAVVGPDYSFGHDEFGAFQPRLTSLNPDAEVINEQWPALAERDLNPFITAMQAAAPESVYANLWGDQLVTFVQQAGPLGLFEDANFVGLFDTDFMKAIGSDLPEGLLGYSRAPFYAIDTPQMATFIESHLALTKQYPSDWAIMAYDAVYALKAAAEKAGSTEGDAVAAALDDLKFQSLRGELTIRACDHQANVSEYVGTTVNDGKYPFPYLKDVTAVPGEELWNTCDEVAAMRAAE